MPTQLDPQAVALAKAIRDTETGNKPVAGASGEQGRYQFMPSTWSHSAAQYLGDANAPMSLENENKVAYSRIKSWKDQGYNPGQIASLWNSGSPNFKGKVGVNKMGVKYDVPSYVQNVYKNYQKYKPQEQATTPAAAPAAPKQTLTGKVADAVNPFGVLAGVGKSAVGALGGIGTLFEKGASAITKGLGITPLSETAPGPSLGQKLTQFAQPTSTAQKIGKGIGDVAQLMAPTGLEEAGAGLAAKIAPEAPKLVKGALGLAGKAAGGALEFGGKTAIQTGGDVKQTGQAALLGGAFPVAGAALGKVAGVAGKGALELLGKSTGAGEAALREAYNNPNVIKFARQAGKQGGIEALQEQALNEARSGLSKIKEARASSYTRALEKVKAIKSQIDPIVQGTRQKATELLTEAGIKTKPGKLLNNLDFGSSIIEKGQGSVQKAVNDVMKWTDNTPAGLDKLKKKLASHLAEVRDAPGAYQIIKGLRDSVRDGLETNVPGYREMTQGYHQASNLIEELQKTMSLGDKASRDTALRKLMSAIRQDNGLRQDMLRTLGSAGGKDIIGKIAGAQLSPLSARGLAGVIEGPAGGAGALEAMLNPTHIPVLLMYLSVSSPRLMAEAVNLLGRNKGTVLAPFVKQGLKAIIQEAIRQNPQNEKASPLSN